MPFSEPVPLERRAVILGGLIGAAALSGCTRFPSLATPNPSTTTSPASLTSATPAATTTLRGELTSRATGDIRSWVIYLPPGAAQGDRPPVAIAMHGLGDDITMLDTLRYPQHLAEATERSQRPFAIAAINGTDLFWQRKGGKDAGRLVAVEFRRLLADQGLDVGRLALTGWSMGGWGALRLACDELHGQLRAVAALSAPCYSRLSDAPETGWMTPAEFRLNNFFGRPERLRDLPLYLACGRSDAFYPGNIRFADRLAGTRGVIKPVRDFRAGDHSRQFWDAVAPAQFDFLAAQL